MRREELYLRDIVDAAVAVEGFLAGVTQDTFLASDLLRSAVLHKLTIIGEAAARISRDFADRFPEIDWAAISGFRNIAIHEYFAVDWRIVWVAAAKETPVLRVQIEIILNKEFSE